MQGVWRHLIDDRFISAYQHGLVLKCADGLVRRVYPRIISYSADYPEKFVLSSTILRLDVTSIFSRALLATIRNKGTHPCPRCLVPQSNLHKMGGVHDRRNRESNRRTYPMEDIQRARDLIYRHGKHTSSVPVEAILSPQSWVPTIVCPAFSYLFSINRLLFVFLECIRGEVEAFGI
jgi:hypothetical protein